MKNKLNVLSVQVFGIIAFITIFILSAATCFSQSINSAEALKEYLNKQPANSSDKPIKVTMAANTPMLPKIAEAINSASKYVSLNLTGNALTHIPEKAFEDCEMLVSINIPNGVSGIWDSAFSYCTNLTSVTIPNSVNVIKKYAFSGCESLTSVTIPDSVISIEESAFLGCTSLTSITIPKSVKEICHWVFFECINLTSVTFQGMISSEGLLVYNDRFYGVQSAFLGDLREKYLSGGIGTYVVTGKNRNGDPIWRKQ